MSEKAAWNQRSRYSRRAILRAGAKLSVGAAGLVLVGCSSKDVDGGSARQAADAPAEPAELEQAAQDDAGTQSQTVEQAVAEGEDGRASATTHPAIAHRAGVPVDRTTIGFLDAQVEIIDFSDFQ